MRRVKNFGLGVAYYFGFGPGPREHGGAAADDPIPLVATASALTRGGLMTLALATWAGALVVVVFDWPLPATLRDAAAGSLLWGCFYFFLDIRRQVPAADAYGDPPEHAEIERPRVLHARLLIAVPVCVGLAWLADRWDLGAAFVPGQLGGIAVASLAGAVLSRRWEREHDGLVLLNRRESDDAEFFVATPTVAQGLAARR